MSSSEPGVSQLLLVATDRYGRVELVEEWTWPHGESRVARGRTSSEDVVVKWVRSPRTFAREVRALRELQLAAPSLLESSQTISARQNVTRDAHNLLQLRWHCSLTQTHLGRVDHDKTRPITVSHHGSFTSNDRHPVHW